jgi:hypothetical protein
LDLHAWIIKAVWGIQWQEHKLIETTVVVYSSTSTWCRRVGFINEPADQEEPA